jgi:hypothetical protein
VYSADPAPTAATKYDEITYIDVMTKDLKVMDATAIAFCRDNKIRSSCSTCRHRQPAGILRGERVGTIIQELTDMRDAPSSPCRYAGRRDRRDPSRRNRQDGEGGRARAEASSRPFAPAELSGTRSRS